MKLGRAFKPFFLWTATALYVSGLAVWALAFPSFQADHGYGPEPSPLRPGVLHAHSIAGLLFLGLFGYLWRAHVEPGLRERRRRRASGLVLVGSCLALFATVPLLFYLNDPRGRAWTASFHAWLGAAVLAPLIVHLRTQAAGLPRAGSASKR